ncbi:hypothetical protein Ancab_039683 [Ancistrocladus abbreviatus]
MMKLILNLLLLILFTSSLSSASMPPSCHDYEKSALLQFKLSFSIDKLASHDSSAYPKTESWKPMGKESNCCLWHGIACDRKSGHVISLDLSSSFLYGFIELNSTLFDLVHLQTLNLADNDFRYSLIPSKIASLLNLKHLNLSSSVFSGEVPSSISSLSNLISLDLSENQDPVSFARLLRFQELSLRTLIQHSTGLEIINLNHVTMSSQVPKGLANLTSLRYLGLQNCELHGAFPKDILLLPNIQIVYVAQNEDLVGHLPEFQNTSKLKELYLSSTGFSGNIPTSIGNVSTLTELLLSDCRFHGSIPLSLSQVIKLTSLDLTLNNFEGQIPNSMANLTQLSRLGLGDNKLTGEVPPGFTNLTRLTFLELGFNELHGSIPSFMSGLENLKVIDLAGNRFSGPVEFDLFVKQKELNVLRLSDVDLIFHTAALNNATFPHFVDLLLAGCNLNQFPKFLHNQTSLEFLELSNNQIEGPLFVPPSSNLLAYALSNNALSGEIPTSICNATSLNMLYLEQNTLTGKIPQCLWNLSNSLAMLSLSHNILQGTIPNTFSSACTLTMINLADNQLHGQVPRSLANCSSLEVLDLGNNFIIDNFPNWLGALPELQALALGSNRLYGALPARFGLGFPNLRIIDLSDNKLTGNLSNEIFLNWNAMRVQHQSQLYMTFTKSLRVLSFNEESSLYYSIEIKYKGRETKYEHILNIFTSIDLSNNEFVGKIPDSIGNLIGLQALNLSHNKLIGSIPRSLGNLSNLESMDLSCNLLSGEIPQQLTKLTFLEIFNVSYNHLTGAIPQGNQLNTFGNDSFEGNTGLCGRPLTNNCGELETQSPPQPQHNLYDGEDEESSTLVQWIIISMGYLSGLVVGVILGHIFTSRYHEWFVGTFGRRWQLNKRRARR